MRFVKIASLLMIGATAPAPASSQTLLDKLIAKVGKPRDKVATDTQEGALSGGSGRFTAAISSAQQTTIDRLLSQPLQDPKIAADRTAAASLIRILLATGSCARSDAAWNSVNRYHMTPKNWGGGFNIYAANFNMHYHDKAACLDVAQLTNWSKPANNALAFTAYYLAADSGEAAHQSFTLQRGSDGTWQIRNIDSVSQ